MNLQKIKSLLFLLVLISIIGGCKKKHDEQDAAPRTTELVYDASGTHHYFQGYIKTLFNITVISNDKNIILYSADNTDKASISKISPSGSLIWRKSYALTDYNCSALLKIAKTTNNGYFIFGPSYDSGLPNQDFTLWKLNSLGDTVSTKTFGSWKEENGKNIISTLDGNYLLQGYSSNGTDWDTHLFKVDLSGNILWEKSFFQNEYRGVYSIIGTDDGGSILTGTIDSLNPQKLGFITKIDAAGSLLWEKTLSPSFPGYTLQLQNGDLVTTTKSGINFGLYKCNSNGDSIWSKFYPAAGGYITAFRKLLKSSDGNIFVVGTIMGNQDYNIYLAKISADGNLLWQKSCGGNDQEEFADAIIGPNNDIYIIGGFLNRSLDLFMLVSDQNGHLK